MANELLTMSETVFSKDDKFIIKNGEPWVTSMYVKDVTGKRHDNILSDIRKILGESEEEFGVLNFKESLYISEQNKKQPMYIISEDGSSVLLGGYSISHRIKIQKELREFKNNQTPVVQLPLNYIQALEALVSSEKEKLQLQEDKKILDEAKKKAEKEVVVLTQEVDYKQKLIDEFNNDTDMASKRQRLTKIIAKAGCLFKERWAKLYEEYQLVHHLNLKIQLDNYNKQHKPKAKNKIDYIEKSGGINSLYELAVKIFHNDVQKLIQETYFTVATTNSLVIR